VEEKGGETSGRKRAFRLGNWVGERRVKKTNDGARTIEGGDGPIANPSLL